MKQKIRLGSGSGFWGDGMDPAVELLQHGELDYMGFDFLAELTMALLQRQKLKDPGSGYVPDAVQSMAQLLPLARTRGTRLISNGGGANPGAAAQRIVEQARVQGLQGTRVALVEGDDLLDQVDAMRAAGVSLANMETGSTAFDGIRGRLVAAHAYTDSSGIIQALQAQADVVVTGRVSDNAIYVGPIMHEYGWQHDAAHADRVAAAIVMGHIVECSSACTGGMSSRFAEMPRMGHVGFPYFDFYRDGSAELSKVAGSGGKVDAFTVKEHIVYEINDPKRYLMPDGVPDFTTLELEETGPDRVRVRGVKGAPAPDQLKLILAYSDGWIGESLAFFPWPHAYDRAVKARQTMLERFEVMGLKADQVHFDFVGLNTLHGPAAPMPPREVLESLNEVGLRCAVRTRTREEAEKVRRAGSHMWIMGPGGTSFGAPIKCRPVISLWPTLIPRDCVKQTVRVLEA